MVKWSLSGQPLILASASSVRAKILEAAKLYIEIIPADIDEDAIKQSALQSGFSFDEVVILLAELKAESVSQQQDGYVLGCDQILSNGEQLFSKPKSLAEARSHLLKLQGREHVLITACVLFYGQKRIWHHLSTSSLTMLTLSEAKIDEYISSFPEDCLSTPGAYKIEAGGAHLFSDITGSSYDILGLPLLPLLAFLRERGLSVEKT
jgi:septum formation protein